jgi:predicted DNA-binding transcriptional regulator AlpA
MTALFLIVGLLTEMTGSALIDIGELAARLGFTAKALYNRLNQPDPDLPTPIRIGRSLRWDPEKVEEWLDAKVESQEGGGRR